MLLSDYLKGVIDNRGKNPKEYLQQGPFPVLDNYLIKNELYPDISQVNRYIDEQTYNSFLRGYCRTGMVVMTLVGNGIANVTTIHNTKWVIIQNTIGFDVKADKLLDLYLYYFLLYKGDEIREFDRGSGQPSIKKTDLLGMEVKFPDLHTQQKIVDLLSCLDKKIYSNKQINNNLEQQAQALFQQYFGIKDPNGNINDILDEMPKSKIKVGDAKDVRGPYPFFTSGQNILEYTEALVDGRNIFLNTGGNADVKYYIGPAAYSTDTWCIKAKNNMTDMLYLLLKGMQTELDSIYFEGSALRHLQKPKLKSLAIYIPTDEELKTFNSIVASLFNKIAANVAENKILEHTRDALLPKLMSGEIDVSKVDISDPSCLDKSLFIGLVSLIGLVLINPLFFGAQWRLLQEVINSPTAETVCFIALAYFVGLVMNRMASVFLEEILMTDVAPERGTWLSHKIKIQWHDYKEYVSAEKEDVFLKTLSREYALSRNVLMASIVLMIFALAVGSSVVGVTCLAISFVFYLSVRKHAKKLSERINIALHK